MSSNQDALQRLRSYSWSSAQQARAVADDAAANILALLDLQHSLETVQRELPRDRDQRLARQEPWTVSGYDVGAA